MKSSIKKFIGRLEADETPHQLIVEKDPSYGRFVTVAYRKTPCLCPYEYVTFDLQKDKMVSRKIKTPKKKKEAFERLQFSSEAHALVESFEIVNSQR